MIHVCFGLHDKTGSYSKFVGTSICSIFENAKAPPQSILIHILHDNTLTDDNRDKFSQLAGKYNQLVKFYNVEELCRDKIAEISNLFPTAYKTRFTMGMFYRFFIPAVLPNNLEKAIYLDADIIVNLDIAQLWQIELGDKPLGAIPEHKASSVCFINYAYRKYIVYAGFVDYNDYFNSGVLLMNLNYLRNADEILKDGIKFIGEHNEQFRAFDQDILNYLFSKNYLKLPARFDFFIRSERLKEDMKNKIRRVIYHYTSDLLQLDLSDIFNRLWMKYFLKTPWVEANSIGRLWTEFERIRYNSERYRLKISSIMSGKTRAFFIAPEEIESTKKIFSIRANEMIISAESAESFQKLLDAMKNFRGKSVFFIMTKKFLDEKFPFEKLTEAGFIAGNDFIKGWRLLSKDNGEPFNSYSLVQAM